MMNVVAVVLGGGQGSRLQPLTRHRAKPAVPIAGKYRLVDIPISNCINSDIRRIFLLTQFNSVSLHQHVQSTYRFDPFTRGFVRVLAAQQTPGNILWYQGTADAVRQNLQYFLELKPDLVLVLSGDQLYRADFRKMIEHHRKGHAQVTVCTKKVTRSEAGSLGIMQVDTSSRIVDFVEKPGSGPQLDKLRAPGKGEFFLASMGIYIFDPDVLAALLEHEKSDFGRDVIPDAIRRYRVLSYVFEGYWKDIGTIRAFWEANLALTEMVPEFTFYDARTPIYTHMRFLPPSKISGCELERCLLSEGCIISGGRIRHSVVGIRQVVQEGALIEHSVLMGADFYEEEEPLEGVPPLGVGKNCVIRNAIVDKNARIGEGSFITPEGKRDGISADLYTVREGVIVIPKNAVIPPGTRL